MSQTKITNRKSVMLAIYPHMKTVGYAVMNSPTSVVASGYRYISARNTTSYVEYVSALMELYSPDLIVLEEEGSRKQYRGKHMQFVFNEMEATILQLKYATLHYSRHDIRSHFGNIDKQEIAGSIAKLFSEYRHRIPKPRVSTDGAESPRMSEFDALSLCITHYAHSRCKTP